jgi:hypothetical protein
MNNEKEKEKEIDKVVEDSRKLNDLLAEQAGDAQANVLDIAAEQNDEIAALNKILCGVDTEKKQALLEWAVGLFDKHQKECEAFAGMLKASRKQLESAQKDFDKAMAVKNQQAEWDKMAYDRAASKLDAIGNIIKL